jgi:hypothetical protein
LGALKLSRFPVHRLPCAPNRPAIGSYKYGDKSTQHDNRSAHLRLIDNSQHHWNNGLWKNNWRSQRVD